MIEVENITRHNGVAGQIAYTARVTYPDEPTETVQFVGSVYGGPVVMVTERGTQVFVSDPGQYGEFGPQWVENFFQKER